MLKRKKNEGCIHLHLPDHQMPCCLLAICQLKKKSELKFIINIPQDSKKCNSKRQIHSSFCAQNFVKGTKLKSKVFRICKAYT